MKMATKLALDDMDIAAELRIHSATYDGIAQVLGPGTACGERTPRPT